MRTGEKLGVTVGIGMVGTVAGIVGEPDTGDKVMETLAVSPLETDTAVEYSLYPGLVT